MYNMGEDPRKEKQNPVEKAQQMVAAVATVENPSRDSGKGKKVPLPTDICWRCGNHEGATMQSSGSSV